MSTIAVAEPKRQLMGGAAMFSLLTMPLTAMWLLLVGGLLLVAGLSLAAVRDAGAVPSVALVGLGLLAGPAVYVALALVQ